MPTPPHTQSRREWRVWIDTGGTFTDCLALDPAGGLRRAKVLSSSALRATVSNVIDERRLRIDQAWNATDDFVAGTTLSRISDGRRGVPVRSFDAAESVVTLERGDAGGFAPGDAVAFHFAEAAPILAARLATRTPAGRELPPLSMRLATTRATNALLERRGESVALFITRGFGELLQIGDQTRPDLFAFDIHKPAPLCDRVIEVDERLDAAGQVERPVDLDALRAAAGELPGLGIRAAAVALLHAYRNPAHERAVTAALQDMGFDHISVSHELAPLIRILPRAETTVVDAYVSGVIEAYLDSVASHVRGGRLRVMTSAGGLVDRRAARAKDTLLSGPAGGVVGAVEAARRSGFSRIIGFDMGGTSTDVCRFNGDFEYRFEQRVGDARVMAPALAIETVAAGGGSICDFRHGRLRVGPESAGAEPGPACYGAGGPLTLTDVNLLLGRLDPDRFEIPLSIDAAERAFASLSERIARETGKQTQRIELLEGLLDIANERMADAIAQVSVRRGVDPAEYALVSFGGAGGQHACRIASHLGIRTVIMPRDASLLSALGLGHARVERFAERQVLQNLGDCQDDLPSLVDALAAEASSAVEDEGIGPDKIEVRRVIANMRLLGQDSTIAVDGADAAMLAQRFREAYRAMYGHEPGDRPIEVESIRVVASDVRHDRASVAAAGPTQHARPHGEVRCVMGGAEEIVPAFIREDLSSGDAIEGPAIVFDRSTTFIVEPGWAGEIDAAGALVVEQQSDAHTRAARSRSEFVERDLFMHRFTAIATEMGEQLQRTALSTNIKERRDFSCALLDRDGRLLVSAPHIPVHLGALGLCVRAVRDAVEMSPGDVVVTNHPAYGGSHLPDVTVITPVFDEAGALLAYAASRAHHAEIGGTRPGSMPPDARSLAEEGVVIPPMHIVRRGDARLDDVEDLLRRGPHPSRAVAENITDLRAQIAANHRGATAVRGLIDRHGAGRVSDQMRAITSRSAEYAARALRKMTHGQHRAVESLDDGAEIHVTIEVGEASMAIDFAGTSDVHPGNLNATPAIVHSAVIFVLRSLVGEAMPLNEGILAAVEVRIPAGMLNPPFEPDPARCPAVVGGNTETSQRLVDTLLKALEVCGAGQGTMNNVLFGNDRFGYYETLGGGAGAGPGWDGASAVHVHMTNTRMTDPEVLEHRYPVVLERMAIRRGSGGAGAHRGGDGLVRELRFREALSLSVLTQRRDSGPYGMAGGHQGLPGSQRVLRHSGDTVRLGSVDGCDVEPGDRLLIETPGGGGYGKPEKDGKTR